jgi:hypothetical protein
MVTLTFAACNFGLTLWDWYNQTNGANTYGYRTACGGTQTPAYSPTEATWLGIIIFFIYNNEVYAQQIPFAGDLVCSGSISNC